MFISNSFFKMLDIACQAVSRCAPLNAQSMKNVVPILVEREYDGRCRQMEDIVCLPEARRRSINDELKLVPRPRIV